MRITIDTNILVRYLISDDDPGQTVRAKKVITEANLIAVTVPSLCELVWVLGSVYGIGKPAMATALRELDYIENLVMDRPVVEAGIQFLELGGDFADGAIAFEGRSLGGETFVSFDKRAVALVEQQGGLARLVKA